MAARAAPTLVVLLGLFTAGAAGSGTLRNQMRGPLLEALQMRSLRWQRSAQSPGPTSVPASGNAAGDDAARDDVVGPAAGGSGSAAAGSGGDAVATPLPTMTVPSVGNITGGASSTQTPAPRFDTGVVPADLEAHSARAEDTLVDAVELAQVSEVKRVVFRALSKLRSAQIKEFDTIAQLQTGAIDAFNDHFSFRGQNGVNYTMEEDSGEDLPVFLPGEEPWWSAPGGPDWTQDLDHSSSEDRRGKPARASANGKPGRTADGAPCICYPELLQVAAPTDDDPASSALAEIRACCADTNAAHLSE